MKKFIGKLILSIALIASANSLTMAQTGNPSGSYDSLAISNINALVMHYSDLTTKLFNNTYDDSLRVAFNSLFKEDALVFRDYTTEKAALSPEEYVYYLNNFFGMYKPICTISSSVEIADLKYIPSGNYYVAKVKINKHLTARYNKENQSVDNEPANYLLQMEILVTETKRGTRFLGIRDITPVETADVAVIEKTVKEKAIKEKVVKPAKEEPVKEKPVKEQPVKVVKEKVEKPEKIKVEKTPSDNENLVFLNWSIGSNMGIGSVNSESKSYKINESSYLGWQAGLSGVFGVSDRLYIGAGLGFHFGTVKLGYENTNFSLEFNDELNASVDTYTRNAFITDIDETIKFTNLNLQALVYLDLLKSDNNKLLLGTGLSIGIGMSETSEVTATTKYTGTFHTVSGQTFPEPFTIGETSSVPIYGFQTSEFNKEFDLDSKMALSLPLNLKAIHVFDNNIFLGAGIESLIPLSSWLSGESSHQRLFVTRDDLDSSLAATVSSSKRPIYLGFGISVGIKF
jgi:hypothetical protein